MDDGGDHPTDGIAPLDLSRDARAMDDSGTPAALIENARRRGDVVVVESIEAAEVAVEFPMGTLWRQQTGCDRFVRLRVPRDGMNYALVRSTPA
jgi:hypothetical protein